MQSNRILSQTLEAPVMELKKYPDRILRTKCSPIREITDEDLARAREMLDFMYEAEGAGLAGPQVGWASRIVTLDVEGEGKGERIFVNPRIISLDGEVEEEEGCLSVPGVRVPVRRAERVVVAAYTVRGKRVEQKAEGMLARAWQHELDHLNGVLLVDHLDATVLVEIRHSLRQLELEAKSHNKR